MVKRRSIFLYPFSVLYGLITSIRNVLYNTEVLKSYEFAVPIISVGNLAAGGTGKTPQAEYLISLLKKDFRVALLSRGYRRKSYGFLMANQDSTVADIGDEPMQIFRKFPDVTVAVDGNRVRGIRNILDKRPDTSVIILDDAFQHRRINPGLSILLTAFDNLMIHDEHLPYGNLRENARNMRRADIILVTKSPVDISPIQRRIIVKEINKAAYQNLYFTSITYGDPVSIFRSVKPDIQPGPVKAGVNQGIVLVTGIADPGPFYEYMKKFSGEIIHLRFRDHHMFNSNDIDNIASALADLKSTAKYVITTEKDAVRLREFTNIAEEVRSSFYYIPTGIYFLNDDRDEFDNMVTDYVRKNKRNNRVS